MIDCSASQATESRAAAATRSSPLNVGVLTSSISRRAGGVFDAVRCLTRSLANEHDVAIEVLGLRDDASDQDYGQWSPLRPSVHAVIGPASFGYAPDMARALARFDLDIIHSHGLWMYPSIAALAWSRRGLKPSLISPHGMLDRWALRHSRWKKRLAGSLFEESHLRNAACIHALCGSEAQAIREFGLRNPICVIPNGVDLPTHQPTQPPPWAGQVPAGASVLLYLGRLHPKKGLPDLIRAWRRLQLSVPSRANDWHLAIAGWDQTGHTETLHQLIRELDLGGRVHLLGPQFGEHKAAAWYHADAFVLPSLSEGLPLVVLEAWAYGKPVLMTAACNLPEGFEAEAALSMEPNPAGIHSALETLLAMTEAERQAMGQRGRNLVSRRFTWSRIAADMKEIYVWTLGGGPRPDTLWQM